MHHSTLRVELGSSDQADQFRSLLTAAKHVSEISIKLNWKAIRSYAQDLCLDIAKVGTATLELDGITFDIHPQGHVQYTSDLFSEQIISDNGLQFITLLNYPQPQQQHLHFSRFSLQSTFSQERLTQSWVDMRDELNDICDLESKVQEASDCIAVVKEIQAVLEKHELFDVRMITIYNGTWDAMFDLKKCTLTELETWEMDCPEAVLTSGSLIKATVDIANLVFDQELFSRIAHDNTGLQELNFSYPGHNVQYHAAHIVRTWRVSPRPFRLNILERMHGTRGRVIAQLTMDKVGSERIQVLEWDCDQIFDPLSDFSASFLDIATKQHPTALILFTLDVCQLSRVGLDSVQVFSANPASSTSMSCAVPPDPPYQNPSPRFLVRLDGSPSSLWFSPAATSTSGSSSGHCLPLLHNCCVSTYKAQGHQSKNSRIRASCFSTSSSTPTP